MGWRLSDSPSSLAAFEAATRRVGRSLLRPRWLGIGIPLALRSLPAVFVVVLCAWWTSAMLAAIATGDRRVTLDVLTVDLPPPGSSVTVGYAELAQVKGADSAESNHIRLARDAAGGMTIANAVTSRRLEVGKAGGTTRDADRLLLRPGRSVEVVIGRRTLTFTGLTVEAGQGGRLDVTSVEGPNTTRYTVVTRGRSVEVTRTQPGPPTVIDDCPADFLFVGLREGIERIAHGIAPGSGPVLALAISSGSDACRIGRTAYVPFGPADGTGRGGAAASSAEINLLWSLDESSFALKLGRDAEFQRGTIRVTETRNGKTSAREPMRGVAWPVAACSEPQAGAGTKAGTEADIPPVGSFVAGRGRYAICAQPDGRRVEIRPEAKAALFRDATCKAAPDGEDPAAEQDRRHACPSAIPETKPAHRTFTSPANIFDASPIRPNPNRTATGRTAESSLAYLRLATFGLCLMVVVFLAVRAARLARSAAAGSTSRAIAAPILLGVSTALAAFPEIAAGFGVRPTAGPIWRATICNWALVGLVMASLPRSGTLLTLVWATFTGLAAVGSITLTTLAAQLGSTDAIDFIGKHKLVFIDLLPPLAMIVAVTPERWPREAIATFLLGSRLTGGRRVVTSAVLPGLVHILVIGGLLAWLLFGTQQGVLDILQPIEFGKFWAIVLVAVVLTTFERQARQVVTFGSPWIPFLSVVLVLLFVVLLAVAPIARRDFSPLIVVVATVGLVLACRGYDLLRWIRFEGRHLDAVQSVPHRFPPRATRRLRLGWLSPSPQRRIDRSNLYSPISALKGGMALVGIAALLLWGPSFLAVHVLKIESGILPAERECRIQTLVEARGKGRLTPLERFLAWDDLDYAMLDRPASTVCPSAPLPAGESPPPALAIRFPELSFHVARSRSEVAAAPCRASREMTGNGVGLGSLDPARAVFGLSSATAWMLGVGLGEDDPLCRPLDDPLRLAAGTERANLLTVRGAATIPVARNDFAGAFLLAQHGIESALLLLAFQIGLMLLSLFVYVRLQWPFPGDQREAVVRYFSGVVVLGSAWLFGVQWVLAWSNVLGLLPVMGQPMTWLSYATSHHLLMALPAALALLLATRLSAAGRPPPKPRVPPRRRGR